MDLTLLDLLAFLRPSMNTTTGASPYLNSTFACMLDQTVAPMHLGLCGNASLFTTFRPKARFIAPEGWMNDPMGMYQRADGSIHAGYQSHPQHIQWGNISQGAAHSPDMTYWTDFGSPNDYKTIWPSEIYDIRGVFDGSIIKNGFEGHPSILYTSTTMGQLGATVNETEGVETQSLAYTTDDGASWIKLPYGAGGNPVIYNWPETNLTGFRDPYVFESPELLKLLGNSSQGASGSLLATVSGGVHGAGPKLWFYRQTEEGDVTHWTNLGPIAEKQAKSSWSEYSGNVGTNFETAFVTRINADGAATDDGSDASALNIIGYGTEQGRPDHQNHWPLWAAVDFKTVNESITSTVKFAGVADWGQSYAFVAFPVDNRSVLIGWTYEDDANLALATQMGYQGAFTLFRDLFVKTVKHVDPSTPGLYQQGSWQVTNGTTAEDGVTITTLGQRVIPETLAAYKSGSEISYPEDTVLKTVYKPFAVQPKSRFYTIAGSFVFNLNSTASAGLRVLSSDDEFTDILYNPAAEELTVIRSQSSLIKTFGNATELGKLKLWPQVGATTVSLNLTVIVDNSVVEIYANDEFALTTRVYPWLEKSIGAGLLYLNNGTATNGTDVKASGLELWDGLINAWPERAANTSQGLVWDGPSAAIYGLWTGI